MKLDTNFSMEQGPGPTSVFLLRLSDAKGQSEHRISHTEALGACLAFFMSGQGRAFVARHSLSPQVLFDGLPANFEQSARIDGPGFTLDIERLS